MSTETETTTEEGTAEGEGTTTPPPEGGDAAELRTALEAERKARKAAERKVKEATDAAEAARAATLSADEKVVEEARKAGREEATTALRGKLAATALRAAAAGKLANPADAAAFIPLDKVEMDDDGEADPKALDALIADLLKDRPYLAANAGAKPTPLRGGGGQESTGSQDMNALIRGLAVGR